MTLDDIWPFDLYHFVGGVPPCPTPRPTHTDGREMHVMGLRGILAYCHFSHHIALDADRWPDEMRLSDEPRQRRRGGAARLRTA